MKKKCVSVLMAALLLVFALMPGTTVWADQENSAVTEAKNAVVRILTEYEDGSYTTGSAFGIGKKGEAPEYFVTTAHNCLEEDGSPAREIYILLDSSAVRTTPGSDGVPMADMDMSRVVRCEVVNRDSITLYPDVAILKAEQPVADRGRLVLRRSSEALEDGQSVFALGFPWEAENAAESAGGKSQNILAGINDVEVREGTVSVISKEEIGDVFLGTDVIAHTSVVSRGNTGGPLVDETGAAVGINSYIGKNENTEGGTGRGFSTCIDYAAEILEENGIAFDTAREGAFELNTKNIILLVMIVLIIAAAAILILRFRRLGREYLAEQAEKEAQELRLQGLSGLFAGRRFPLETQLTIGRAPGNNIVYPTDTEGVSGQHCVVIKSSGQIYVKDTGSTYGTFLNMTERLPANQLVSVHVGDKISLASPEETFIITRKGGML